MSQPPSPAERLDRAVEGVLDGLSPVAAAGSAVGVGVTAYARWRSTRRSSAAVRLLHR